jgi:hypothetical protein
MKRIGLSFLLVLAVALPLPTLVSAQQSGGAIKGYVQDSQGLAAPGATITVTSDSLMGARTVTSDREGFYRIVNLPPGRYRVEVTLQGFSSSLRSNVRVEVGGTTTTDAVLAVARMAEEVVVPVSAPVVDVERTERQFNLDSAAIAALPIEGRMTFQSAWQLLPGIVLDRTQQPLVNSSFQGYEGGADGVRNQHDIHETAIFVDGMDVNDTQTGLNTMNFASEAIDEITVKTAGFEAGLGTARNGQMQVLTKSGGNVLSGSALLQIAPENWNWSNVEGGSSQKLKYYRPQLTLGGPIRRDKVWFFGSWLYDYENLTYPNTVVTSNLARQRRGNVWYAKLTAQPNAANRISLSFGYDKTSTRNGGADQGDSRFATEDVMWTNEIGGPLGSLTWTSTLSSNAVFQLEGGYSFKPQHNTAQGEGPEQRYFQTLRGTLASIEGNGQRDYDSPRHVLLIRPSLTLFPSGHFLGRHEVKLGAEARPYQKLGRAFIFNADSGGFYQYSYSLDFAARGLTEPYLYEARQVFPVGPYNEVRVTQYAAYIQDRWNPTRKLTVNLGLRFEKQTHRSYHRDELPSYLESFDPNIRDDVEFDDAGLAPRLGAAYDLGTQGVVRLSAGRYFERIGAGDINNYPRGQAFNVYRVPNAQFGRGPEALTLFTQGSLPINASFNRNLQMEYNDELTVGYERKLPGDIAAEAAFIYRKIAIGEASDANVVFADGTFERIDPDFNAVNRREFLEGDQRMRKVSYKSLQVSLRRNFTSRSGVLASFSRFFTKMDFLRFDPTETFQFAYASVDDLDRSNYGPRWNVKVAGYYTFPKDFSVSAFLNGTSGQWVNDITGDYAWNDDAPRVSLSNGRVVSDIIWQARNSYFAGRRYGASGRYSDNTYNLNLRAQKGINLGGRRRLELSADLYNAFNWGAFASFQSADVRRLDVYPVQITPQRPRALQANVRFAF